MFERCLSRDGWKTIYMLTALKFNACHSIMLERGKNDRMHHGVMFLSEPIWAGADKHPWGIWLGMDVYCTLSNRRQKAVAVSGIFCPVWKGYCLNIGCIFGIRQPSSSHLWLKIIKTKKKHPQRNIYATETIFYVGPLKPIPAQSNRQNYSSHTGLNNIHTDVI